MFGGIRHFKYRGVIPRSLSYVFQEIEKFKTVQFNLSIQYFQVYHDLIYDLLSDDEKEMQVAEDESGTPFVQNLSTHTVTEVHSALQLLIDGEAKLHLTEHKLDRKVHRSHVIFVLDLVGRKGTRMTHSKLIMVDLAAAEEAGDAAFVNKSISYLQQLVVSIVNKDTRHLPFRRSKMTYLMRDAIGGNCRTACIANIWPEAVNNRETISTFQFANDLGKVRNDAKVNTLEPPELRIEKLEAELKTLEAENELQAELGGAIKIDGLKQDEEAQVVDLVRLFLSDEIEQVPLPSVAHIKAIFGEIKRRYLDIPNYVLKEVGRTFSLTERVKNAKAPKDVGTIDGAGFSIGVAASQDRPANIRTAMKADRAVGGGGARADNPPVPTKDQMFEIFKIRDGKALSTELVAGKRETGELMEQKQRIVADINAAQEELERLTQLIEAKNLRTRDQMFEDEAQLLKDELATKRHYRECYQTLQKTQSDIDVLKEKCAQARIALLTAFEEWHSKWTRDQLYTEKVVPPHSETDLPPTGKDAGKAKKAAPAKPPPRKPAPRGRK
jgi:kinesin family protein 6/9